MTREDVEVQLFLLSNIFRRLRIGIFLCKGEILHIVGSVLPGGDS